jgi:hypothetical protein
MWRLAPAALVLAGCHRDVVLDATATKTAPVAEVAAAGRPHSANIREVSVAEQGDAAVTIDALGELRLWTALDGTRQPVPISSPAPSQIAVIRTAFEVVVGVLDQAGSAHVLRFGRDGAARGAAAISGDVPITQVAGIADRLLLLRADATVEALDASGAVRSRLSPDPGERIAALVVRAGGALAVLANDDGTATAVRWIAAGDSLAWGARVALPAAIDPACVALSPSHTLLAAAEATSRLMFVYDVSVSPALATPTDIQLQPGEAIGFIDDRDLAALSPLRWWAVGKKPVDPWAPTTQPEASTTTNAAAFANGFLVAGQGPNLALVTPSRVRYLGWADMNPAMTSIVGDQIAVATSGHHFAWLDRSLVERRTADLPAGTSYGVPVGEHHVLTSEGGPKGFVVKLVDVDHADQALEIGHYANVQRLQLEPHTQTLAFDDGAWLYRYHLDLAHTAVTSLTKTNLAGETSYFVLDPALAGGVVAIAATLNNTTTQIDELREQAGKLVRKKRELLSGYVSAVDARGGVWWRGITDASIHHGDVMLPAGDIVPDHAGASVLESDGTTLALLDSGGKERWRVPAWRSYTFAFTEDDRQVVLRGTGGVVVLDAATGERSAVACGWRFGIHDRAPDAIAPGVDSVCEDGER